MVPPAPRQGAVAVVFLAGAQGARQIEKPGGRSLAFPYGEGTPIAGIVWRLGRADAVARRRGFGGRQLRGSVTSRRASFPVQRLTLPHMVDLDPETHRASQSARLNLYETATPERL